MLIQKSRIRGLLSFNDASLEMRPLNVLIGPNASGKSNLIEVVALLRALPSDLPDFFAKNGPTADWFWKGGPVAGNEHESGGSIKVEITNPLEGNPLRLVLRLSHRSQFPHIDEERLEYARPAHGHTDPYWFFSVTNRYGRIKTYPSEDGDFANPGTGSDDGDRANPAIGPDDLPPGQSVLRERRDPTLYPQVSGVARSLDAIRLFREWNMGRASSVRDAARTDGPSDFLSEDFSNLALVLNNLQNGPAFETVESNLNRFYESYERISVNIQASRAELMIREKGLSSAVPATRLSDGTLRFLALMAILCHPEPPPLVCIEEPELGLHPDIIPIIAELMESASERTQLVITTHSVKLINALSNAPESVVICTLDPGEGTQLERLSRQELNPWLERFELGELWEMGEIGGEQVVAPITIYYESSPALREGFSRFFSGISGAKPKLVAGKSFANTIRAFVTAVEHRGATSFLLVDADGPDDGRLLQKVTANPEWESGLGVRTEQVHFMVQVMESWLIADRDALEAYYGQGFRPARLPANPKVEEILKGDVAKGLRDATRDTNKGPYHKTKHAPTIFARVDPVRVRGAAPSYARLFHAIESASGKSA